MSTVIQLTRILNEPPVVQPVPGIVVRNYQGRDDIEAWLAIRERAFRAGPLPARTWNAAEFSEAFLDRWWWNPERMWLAEAQGRPVATVVLAERGEPDDSRPVVHYLAVLPAWRRLGIGRLLMSHLEQTCWQEGRRQIWLETHSAWREAAQLYEALGYQPADSVPS